MAEPIVDEKNKTEEELPISLMRGGTLYWVQAKAGLIRPNQWNLGKRLPLLLAIVWIPLVALTAVHGAASLHALLTDYRLNCRVFVAIPLLLIAQVGMEQRFREMGKYFLDANLVRSEDLGHFRSIMGKARRLRDANLPEILVIVCAYLLIGYFLESRTPNEASWAIISGTGVRTSAGYYSILITQAVFLVMLGLVLWKWMIWILVLRDLSTMALQMDPTDGDLAAGMGFLGEIPKAFVPVMLAIATVMGATWRQQVLAGQLELKSLTLPVATLAVVTFVIFVAPLVLYTPRLAKVKREGLRIYGALQHLHSLQFRQKWVDARNENLPTLLGSSDVSSLADISAGFKNVEGMKVFPIRKSALIALALALAIPMLPVVTTQIPLKELLKKLLQAMH